MASLCNTMLTRTTLSVLILAISSASAQTPFFFQNGTPIFSAGAFVNGSFVPSFNGTFVQNNGTTGTFVANPATTFNGINGITTFPFGTTTTPIGTNVQTGLSSINSLTGLVNPVNPFAGITTTDGTFIKPAFNNFRLRGYRNGDFYNRRVRYATLPDTDSNDDDEVNFNLPRVSPVGPIAGQTAYACINERCNDDYNPVCGEDNRTYRNQCQMECFGVDFSRDGACRSF